MKEKIKLPEIEGAYDETISDDAVEKSASLEFLDRTAQSIAPKTYGRAKTVRKYLSGEEKVPTAGDIFWSAAKGILHYVFPKTSEKYGPRVLGRYWDPEAYSIVDSTTKKGLSGNFALKYKPVKYWELKGIAKEVLGRDYEVPPIAVQDGDSAYVAQDIENAIGPLYKWIEKKSKLPGERVRKAAKAGARLHEEVESAYQKVTGKGELPESDHGKIQAYLLQSLKHSESEDAQDIYRVWSLIDSHRPGTFGYFIREHYKAFEQAVSEGWRKYKPGFYRQPSIAGASY